MSGNLKKRVSVRDLCLMAKVPEEKVLDWANMADFPAPSGNTWDYAEVLAWLLKGGDTEWFFTIKVYQLKSMCRELDGPCPITQDEASKVLQPKLADLFRKEQMAVHGPRAAEDTSIYSGEAPEPPSRTSRYLATAFVSTMLAGFLLMVLR